MATPRTNYTFYFLHDPQDEGVGYVGMTQEPMPVRISKHISEAIKREHSPNSPKNVWLREILDRGLKPYAQILEVSGFQDGVQAGIRESYWIKKKEEEGKILKNSTTGGLGAPGLTYTHTEEAKKAIAEASRVYGEDTYETILALKKEGKTTTEILKATGMGRTTFNKEYKPRLDQDLNSEA